MRYACMILAFVCTFTAVETNLRLLFLFEVVFLVSFPSHCYFVENFSSK